MFLTNRGTCITKV